MDEFKTVSLQIFTTLMMTHSQSHPISEETDWTALAQVSMLATASLITEWNNPYYGFVFGSPKEDGQDEPT